MNIPDLKTASFFAVNFKNDLKILHLTTEPVKHLVKELSATPAYYDYRTKFVEVVGKNKNYLMDKNSVMKSIADFVQS